MNRYGATRPLALGPALALVLVLVAMTPQGSVGSVGRNSDQAVPDPEPIGLLSPPPVPKDAGPSGETISADRLGIPRFSGTPRVKALSGEAVREFERQGTQVVENRDGLVVLEVDHEGQRVRVAALNEHTDAGTDVIGIAFLDEAEIAELEAMERAEAAPLRPQTASAHFKDQSHYHYFYNCSWVFNQGGTYAISWYMCPDDTIWDRLLGYAIAGAIGFPSGPGALLRWIGGMLIGGAEYYFYETDGSLRGSLSDFRQECGWVYWNSSPGPNNHWMYYYCSGSLNWEKAFDDYYQKVFYVKYP